MTSYFVSYSHRDSHGMGFGSMSVVLDEGPDEWDWSTVQFVTELAERRSNISDVVILNWKVLRDGGHL